MGNNSNNSSSQVAESNKLMKHKIINFFDDDEKMERFVDICNNHNVEITGVEGIVFPKINLLTEDGIEITVDVGFLKQDTDFNGKISLSGSGHFEDILDTLERVPSFYKSQFNKINLPELTLTMSASYNGMGTITIPSSFLSGNNSSPDYIKGVLIHEMTHSVDLGIGKISSRDDLIAQMNKSPTSSQGWMKIIANENASDYSRIYRPTSKYFGDNQEFQSKKWGTESLSEAMKITGSMKLMGAENAWIGMPVYKKGKIIAIRKVNYNTWKEINPNMARVAEDIWNAKDLDEARAIIRNAEYDPTLKSRPLVESNYQERSEEHNEGFI